MSHMGPSRKHEKIRKLLSQNFIYGDRSRSRWIGPSGPSLPKIMVRCGLDVLSRKLQRGIYNRQLPEIAEEQLRILLRQIDGDS